MTRNRRQGRAKLLSGAGVRRLLVDSPASLGAGARARRWQLVAHFFPDIGDMRVLDLGGTVDAWHRAPVRPAHVTVLNLFEPGESTENWLKPVAGDACVAEVTLVDAGVVTDFDLVFSNSLIEHVGGHAMRVNLASQIHELAAYHWIQTPYRFFPIEPHWLFPGMQFLPLMTRIALAEKWPLAHTRPSSRADAEMEVLWTELLSMTEMRSYFPTSRLVQERIAGITKSLVAVKSPVGQSLTGVPSS